MHDRGDVRETSNPSGFSFPGELTRMCQLLVARRGRDGVEVIEHPVRVSLSFCQRRKDFFIRRVSVN